MLVSASADLPTAVQSLEEAPLALAARIKARLYTSQFCVCGKSGKEQSEWLACGRIVETHTLTAEERRGQGGLVEALLHLAHLDDVRQVEHGPVAGAEQLQAHSTGPSLIAE